MPYPVLYVRLVNFLRDLNNGLVSPAAAKVDAELNGIQVSLAQVNAAIRGITTADGRLRNVAVAIAQALVGSWTGAAPASPGPIVTDIPWQAAMSNESVLVLIGSTPLHTTAYTVADSGGFLAVTPTTYPATGATVSVWGFEPGAGILTLLASTAFAEGASLIGVEDATGVILADNVEDALVENAGNLASLLIALGNLADYWKRDGSVVATANFDMGGFKVTNAADGSDDGDYITVRQVATYIAAWNDLQRFYLKRDGTTAMAGPLNFGNNKGINLADPDLEEPLDAVNVRSMLRTISTSGAAPVGIILDYIGDTPPTNWLLCDGQAYKGDAYPVLYSLLSSAYREGAAQGCEIATFPKLVGANLTGGAITTLPAMTNFGRGYNGIPQIKVVNPDGTDAPTQPTFSVLVSTPVVMDGPTVLSGGVLTITLNSGGTGVEEGATIQIINALEATPGEPALEQLPAGYFRTPDFRGRVALGAGQESKTPGITDPKDITKGDAYNSSVNDIGDFGGSEQAVGAHQHWVTNGDSGYIGNGWEGPKTKANGYLAGRSNAGGGGMDEKYCFANSNTVADRGLTSNPTPKAGQVTDDSRPPFHVVNKIIKAA